MEQEYTRTEQITLSVNKIIKEIDSIMPNPLDAKTLLRLIPILTKNLIQREPIVAPKQENWIGRAYTTYTGDDRSGYSRPFDYQAFMDAIEKFMPKQELMPFDGLLIRDILEYINEECIAIGFEGHELDKNAEEKLSKHLSKYGIPQDTTTPKCKICNYDIDLNTGQCRQEHDISQEQPTVDIDKVVEDFRPIYAEVCDYIEGRGYDVGHSDLYNIIMGGKLKSILSTLPLQKKFTREEIRTLADDAIYYTNNLDTTSTKEGFITMFDKLGLLQE